MKFRPRFTVRTLVVFMTLVCVYFGAWEATKRYGVPLFGEHARAPTPLFIIVGEIQFGTTVRSDRGSIGIVISAPSERHYIWLFGPTIKLPFSSE